MKNVLENQKAQLKSIQFHCLACGRTTYFAPEGGFLGLCKESALASLVLALLPFRKLTCLHTHTYIYMYVCIYILSDTKLALAARCAEDRESPPSDPRSSFEGLSTASNVFIRRSGLSPVPTPSPIVVLTAVKPGRQFPGSHTAHICSAVAGV